MTIDPAKLNEALERLKLLADGCDVSGLDHLPIVSRANASEFAADLRALLAEVERLKTNFDRQVAGHAMTAQMLAEAKSERDALERERDELRVRGDALAEALEPFARYGAGEDADLIPEECVVSLTYDSAAFDEELGGPNTLLGEPFMRCFRRASGALSQWASEQGDGG